MPWKRKNKQQQQQRRQSYFSDQVIEDYSVANCPCELYFPEPSLTFDEFGAVQEICISGDSMTLLWNKHCVVHVCEILGVPADFRFSLEDTAQECEVCLSVVLNRSKTGDFSYQIRDKLWHEYSHKVGERWRRFVLKFDNEDKERFDQFEEKLKNILGEVNKAEENKNNKLYLLVAVQTKYEKRKSSSSLNKHSRLSLLDLNEVGLNPASGSTKDSPIELTSPPATEESLGESSSEGGKDSPTHRSLTPPFDPAPYMPYGDFIEDKTESVRSTLADNGPVVLKSINYLCDSLHIHPNELPQTLSSILKSAAFSSDDLEAELHQEALKQNQELGNHQKPKPHHYRRRRQKKCDIDISGRLDSEFLPTDQLYISMGYAAGNNQQKEQQQKSENMAEKDADNPRMHKAQEVAQLLQTAINSNDVINAQEYAKQLALQKVTVNVQVVSQSPAEKEKDKEFNLKVNIEDKDSSGGTITLKVRATDTIRDLKNRMLMKHMFPVEVQYWIIGKVIRQDNETLEKCRIKSNGHTAFLYLISAKAAGINKEEFMRRQNMLLNPDYTMALPPQLPLQTPDSGMNHSTSRPGSLVTPGSGATGSASAGKPKMEPRNLDANFNIAGKNEKRTPEKFQGQGLVNTPLQKQPKNEPIVVNPLRQSGAEIAQTLYDLAPQLEAPVGSHNFPNTPYGESRSRIPIMHPEEDEEPQPQQGWACPACTFVNQPTRPGCELCSQARPPDYEIPKDYIITEEEKKRLEFEALIERQTKEAQERERHLQEMEQRQNFANLQETDALEVIPNAEEFTCPICFEEIEVGDGVVLRECLHPFCKECLKHAVLYNEEPVLKCPFQDDIYTCDGTIQDREIKALVTPEGFAKYLARSLSTAESQAQNSFHCKTADCPGWCIYEDHVNFFVCQVCGKENCLTCKAIHQGQNCKQYQEDLRLRARNDKAANQTQLMIKKMLDDGDAMNCPQCHVIVMKKEGCDWIQCSICKTEICWVTKGPRWGPMGNGDISGGCKCRVDGEMCHPDCNNCH